MNSNSFLSRVYHRCNRTWYGRFFSNFLRNIYASDIFKRRLKVYNNGSIRINKTIIGCDNTLFVGKNSLLLNVDIIVIGSNNVIRIGDSCVIRDKTKIWIEGSGCEIVIGDGCSISHDNEFLCQESNRKIMIGMDCMFSHHINVRTSDSHPIFNELGERVNLPQDTIIGNHVWIAPHSIVMKGVEIGDGAIIGSCAVVSKSINKKCLAVGVPAKCVRENVRWERQLE